MFKKILTLLLITALMFTMTTAVFAQDTVEEDTPGFTSITGTYLLEGDIDWRVHAGHPETGAEQKMVITGEGIVDRTYTANISLGKLDIAETTYLESIENLKMITAVKVGFGPADAVYAEDQVYAFYMAPEDGEFGMADYALTATHDYDYIDSFVVDADLALSRGLFARYISMSSGIAKSPYIDDLAVDGSVTISEVFEVLDVLRPLKSVIDWYSLF